MVIVKIITNGTFYFVTASRKWLRLAGCVRVRVRARAVREQHTDAETEQRASQHRTLLPLNASHSLLGGPRVSLCARIYIF